MDLGNAYIGLMLSVDLLNQIVKEAYRTGSIPTRMSPGNLPYPTLGTRHVTVFLDEPDLSTIEPGPRLLLHVTGSLELRAENDADGAVIDVRPLDMRIRLNPRTAVNDAGDPIVELRVDGVEPPVIPEELAATASVVASSALSSILEDLQLPVFRGLIDAVSGTLFATGGAPPAREWAKMTYIAPAGAGTWPALVAAIGLPDTDLTRTLETSPLAVGNGIGIAYDDNFLDPALAAGAAGQIGNDIDGATITRLSLVMQDNAIQVDGRIQKSGATIDFEGPITFLFFRGGNMLLTDAQNVEVDADLPWYLWLVAGLGWVFGPGIGLVMMSELVVPALDSAGDAPDEVRSGLVGTLDNQLAQLVTALNALDSFGGIEAGIVTDSIDVSDGTIAIFAEVIVTPIVAEITDARRFPTHRGQEYASRLRAFQLSNGRRYPTAQLVDLMKLGKIVIPGYHGVNGRVKYVRGNPDDATGNNLSERFTRFDPWNFLDSD